MKAILIAVSATAALLMAGSAFASGLVDNTCAGAGNCNTDNSTHNTANGGAGGSASTGPVTNINANTAKGGNADADALSISGAKATGGSVKNSGNSFNVNDVDTNIRNSNDSSNKNMNKQDQKQKQSQSSYSASDSNVSESGNSDVAINYQRNTAQAYAPALVAAQETCVQSQSVGGQSPAFGLSLGFTHDNAGCNMRRNAAMLYTLKHEAAAIELLCSDDDIRAAMKAAGTPCVADQPAPQTSSTDTGTAKVAALQGMDPVRDDK